MTHQGRIDGAYLIGPNAVLQLIPALRDSGIDPATVFAAAGAAAWLVQPPSAMVNENGVARLHQAVRRVVPPALAQAVLADAGRRTGDYILANRIPAPVRRMLQRLPSWLAALLLTRAIEAHAWTFAGSAVFAVAGRSPLTFTLTGNPIRADSQADAPVCVWHAAVFERLFQALVNLGAHAEETDCEAAGGACCCFRVRW